MKDTATAGRLRRPPRRRSDKAVFQLLQSKLVRMNPRLSSRVDPSPASSESDAEPQELVEPDTSTGLGDDGDDNRSIADAFDPTADSSEEQAADNGARPILRLGLVVGLIVVAVLGGMTGWLGYRTFVSVQDESADSAFLEAARRGAVKLTSIDHAEVESDVQQILDSSTGTFFDDFQQRSQPFVELVKRVQSKTVGTVTAAGLESVRGDQADVLVAVSVKTSLAGAEESEPRLWRMRIGVQKVGEANKVSKVEFVP